MLRILLVFFVPEGGIEPPRLAAYDFESYASTNSATPALWVTFAYFGMLQYLHT